MKYLLLVYGEEAWREAMSRGDRDEFERACRANGDALRESGHLLAVERLQSSSTATLVRIQNGTVSLSDGSFADTKEQIFELYFISAKDLNEAIHVAAWMPQAQAGLIEVRPIVANEYATR